MSPEQQAATDARLQMAREAVRRLVSCPHPGIWVATRQEDGAPNLITSCRCQICGRSWVTVRLWASDPLAQDPASSTGTGTGYY